MAETEISSELRAEFERFSHLMRPGQDTLVVLLKGHLLMEEQLTAIVDVRVSDPAALKGARLSFNQRLRLARALCGRFFPDDIYESLRRINTIRNALAHEAEPTNLDELITDLFAWCSTLERFKLVNNVPTEQKLFLFLSFIYGNLSMLRDVTKVIKNHSPSP